MRIIRNFSVAGVIAVWLLTDLWRMWTPSLITLFGRAAETPPEIMGAYALGVMAVPLVLLALVRGPAPRLAVWLLGAAFVVRLVLRFNPGGGDVQLYGSSLGVALTVAALALLAGSTGRLLIPSALLGVALSVTSHAALGSFGAVWRSDGFDVVLLVVQGALITAAVAMAMRADANDKAQPAAVRSGLLLFPALLLLQLALVNVGRASTVDEVWGPVLVVLAAWLAVAVSIVPWPARRPWPAAVLVLAAVVVTVPLEVTRGGIEGQLSLWSLLAFVVGAAALARLLVFADAGSTARRSARRTALCTGAGAVIWTVFLFVFYAGYDLGYRADWAIVALALLLAVIALWQRSNGLASSVEAEWRGESAGATLGVLAAATILSLLAALIMPTFTIRAVPDGADKDDLTVAAYNLRMGYGINGTFDIIGVAQQIRDSGAQVVLLSEVDRGWLLNGGQDQLAVLARLLDMRAVFGPAGDQVWGDAILTSLPLSDARSEKFPRFDSLTGAGMTMATVEWRGEAVRIISTHLQPDDDGATDRQAEIFAAALRDAAAEGAVIGGGDLNTQPDTAQDARAWQALTASGTSDGLAAIRPALTSASDKLEKQIDHIFVSGVTVTEAQVVNSLLSDHLMITVTVR